MHRVQFLRPTLRVLPLAALTFAAACSSSGPAGGASGGSTSGADPIPSAGGSWDEGTPVHGEWMVAWKNLDSSKPAAEVGLVNESSEIGKKLKSGKASSSAIRVLTDVQMGGLLAQIEKLGFFQYATDGMDIGNAPDTPGRRGIVVVTQDGHAKGLMLTLNQGTSPIPKTYSDTKKIILFAHSQVPGADIRVGLGDADERVLSVPPPSPRLKR